MELQPPVGRDDPQLSPSHRRTSHKIVHSHTFSVVLPDGTGCDVDYRRSSARCHRFSFQTPLNETVYSTTRLDGTTKAIEREAVAAAPIAFTQAQIAEQERMRRRSVPQGSSRASRSDCLLLNRTAEALGGKYAACVKFTSGNIMATGPGHDGPEPVLAELKAGRYLHVTLRAGQEIVIGICNRAERRWQEPQFLVERFSISSREQVPGLDRKRPAKRRERQIPATAVTDEAIASPE